jgi:2-(1,2-epoxy-1,2-dihydrophenyl)acetyl-CoA isomerase
MSAAETTDSTDPSDRAEIVDSGSPTVLGRIVDGVGVIELNRAERANALHPDMYWAVPNLIERYDADDRVGCILVTAAGRSFCAGGDVVRGGSRPRDGASKNRGDGNTDTEGGTGDSGGGQVGATGGSEAGGEPLLDMARMVLLLHESPKISIAALPGAAVGAGIGLALCTDLRIVAPTARLIPGWGALGFSGDFGGTYFLSRMLGTTRAMGVMLDNETIDAARGLELGLFNRVVPAEELQAAALAWATTIAGGPRTAWGFVKQNVFDAQRMTLREALPGESRRMAQSAQTEWHRQAVKRWRREAKAKAGAKAAP